jgi:hypothetical protein
MTGGFLRFVRRNTIAMLALFIALTGTTYAASTALIGKNTVASPQVVNGSLQTKDLSAKARKALKGNRGLRGPQGLQGARGATGAQGVQGIQGPAGPFPDGNLPSGKTIRGNYATAGGPSSGELAYEGISFGYSLASAPTPHYVQSGTAPPECPGTADAPAAAAGNLCVYEATGFGTISSREVCTGNSCPGSNKWGAWVRIASGGTSIFGVRGTWAVTAP